MLQTIKIGKGEKKITHQKYLFIHRKQTTSLESTQTEKKNFVLLYIWETICENQIAVQPKEWKKSKQSQKSSTRTHTFGLTTKIQYTQRHNYNSNNKNNAVKCMATCTGLQLNISNKLGFLSLLQLKMALLFVSCLHFFLI